MLQDMATTWEEQQHKHNEKLEARHKYYELMAQNNKLTKAFDL